MKKLLEKQGEKLSQDSISFVMQYQSKGAASWEGAKDANNGELRFRTLEDEMTLSELCMSRVDSTLYQEFVRWIWSKEGLNSTGVGISTWRVLPSSVRLSSRFRMVRAGFLGFEDESKKYTMTKEERQVNSQKIKWGSLMQRIESTEKVR